MPDDVLSFVAHDLRSPLMAIVLATETLLKLTEASTSGRERVQLERISRSAQEMRRLIDDVLDVADLEAGRLTPASEVQEVGRLFDDTAARLLGAAVDGGVTLVFEPPVGRIDVLCDRGRILQVLSTLIGNALEFTPPGGTITVTARTAGAQAVLGVADTGRPIPAGVAGRLFERTWPANPQARKGRGLGLHLAARLVEAQGGALRVEPAADGGTAFWFKLPLAADPSP